MSAIFYQIFISSPNDSLSKTEKCCISSKMLFPVLKIVKLLYFFPSFPHFPDSKGQMEVENLCHELVSMNLQV